MVCSGLRYFNAPVIFDGTARETRRPMTVAKFDSQEKGFRHNIIRYIIRCIYIGSSLADNLPIVGATFKLSQLLQADLNYVLSIMQIQIFSHSLKLSK